MTNVESPFVQFDEIRNQEPRFLEYFLDDTKPIMVLESGNVGAGSIVRMKQEAFPARNVAKHQQNPENMADHYFLIVGTEKNGTLYIAPITVSKDNTTLDVYIPPSGIIMIFPHEAKTLLGNKRKKPKDLIDEVILPETFRQFDLEQLNTLRKSLHIKDNVHFHWKRSGVVRESESIHIEAALWPWKKLIYFQEDQKQ
jgi:hypothetical protein